MADVNERVSAIEVRLSVLERGAAVDEVHHANVEKRLSGIEDTLKWLVRLVIGGLVLAIVTYAINGGFHVA